MNNRARAIMIAASLSVLLSACGGKANNDDDNPPLPVPMQPRQEDQFGANFGVLFRADPNSEAANASEGDVVGVSLTTEPATIN